MNAHRDSSTTVPVTMRPPQHAGHPGTHIYSICLPTDDRRGPSPATIATPVDSHPRCQPATLDPQSRWAWVAPECTLSALNRQIQPHGLCFTSDADIHSDWVLGDIIHGEPCRMPTLLASTVADRVDRLEILCHDGTAMQVGTDEAELAAIVQAGGRRGEIYRELRALRDRFAEVIRERFPRIPPGLQGYHLDALLPERGFNVARALIGSGNRHAVIRRVRLRLRRFFPHRVLLLLDFPGAFQAADALTTAINQQPAAQPASDQCLVDYRSRAALESPERQLLDNGESWLLVELTDTDPVRLTHRAQTLVDQFQHQPRVNIRRLDHLLQATPPSDPPVPANEDTPPLWETQSSRARAELARRIYGPELLEAFRAFEQIWYSPATNPPPATPAPAIRDTPAPANAAQPGIPSVPATDCMGLRCVVLV